MMRTKVEYNDSELPVNAFFINIAPSGYGKGYSNSIMESIAEGFFDKYQSFIEPNIATQNIADLALKIAPAKNKSQIEVEDELVKEYKKLGNHVMTFSEGTVPGIKQYRNKLLLSGTGSLNFEQDELALNLSKNTEVLTLLLELFEGTTKEKVTKETKESQRTMAIKGVTNTNMHMFGEPTALFNSGPVEAELMKLLSTGYARRCFFGFTDDEPIALSKDDRLAQIKSSSTEKKVSIFNG